MATIDTDLSSATFDMNHAPLYSNNPYAAENLYGHDITDRAFGTDWNSTDVFYQPMGPAFFQNGDQSITQTSEGVNINGMDMLDLMMMDGSAFNYGQ